MGERYPYLWDADFGTDTDGQYIEWIFRRLVLPFFKAHGKKILANAAKASAEVEDDVL